jgi:tetratricopeptide (TPR) repeat protein
LHVYSLRWAIENGMKTYDFLRGDEAYKYAFGATDRRIHYIVLRTRNDTNINGQLDPRSLGLVLERATWYYDEDRLDEAACGFRQVLEIDPDDTTALRRYGRLLYYRQDYMTAKNIYRRLVENDSDDAENWSRLGKTLLALGEYEAAEDALGTAAALPPGESLAAHYYLGRVLQALGKQDDANKAFMLAASMQARNEDDKRRRQMAIEALESTRYH